MSSGSREHFSGASDPPRPTGAVLDACLLFFAFLFPFLSPFPSTLLSFMPLSFPPAL